jgi:hypothetical protein
MFIRRTNTRNRTTGEAYFTHRRVDAVRIGRTVKQRTLLNLGTRFDLPQDQWHALAARIDQILRGQGCQQRLSIDTRQRLKIDTPS